MKANKKMSIISIISLIVAALWVVFLSYYFYQNDFSTKSIEVFYPALGAIIVSAFLAYKAIYIQSPREKKIVESIVILRDRDNGTLYTPLKATTDDSPTSTNACSDGLSEFTKLSYFEKFKSLDINKHISDSTYPQPSNEIDKILLEALEFTFWYWQHCNAHPSWLNEVQITTGINNSGGSISAKALPEMTSEITINSDIIKDNRFIDHYPLSTNLPKGTKLTFENPNSGLRKVILDSSYSTLTIQMSLAGGGIFDPNINRLSKYISTQWGLENSKSISSHNFRIEIAFKLKPFPRFANQAELENEWADTLFKSFKEAFSWDFMRAQIIKRINGQI